MFVNSNETSKPPAEKSNHHNYLHRVTGLHVPPLLELQPATLGQGPHPPLGAGITPLRLLPCAEGVLGSTYPHQG